jgi:hypothetical protein
MTDDTRRAMEAWLATGTDAQVAHARWRLSVDDGPAAAPPPAAARPPAAAAADPLLDGLGDWYPRVRACPHRSGCGCGGMDCSRLGRKVGLLECRRCVEADEDLAGDP